MQCPSCQAKNRPGRRFCAECGGALALACPACGFANEPAEKFCGGCGQPLAVLDSDTARPATSGPASAGQSLPQAYIPAHLAEKILASRSLLEGERKQVTVLFADIRGSLELLQGRDPEEARQILDPTLHAMMEAVHRYEGTVNNLLGDGIMALFGAPLAHEDHAVRACFAALAMRTMIAGYNEQVRRTHGVEVQVRIGLNSGEVVVRAIGNDLSMDYSAIGQTTHLAARMEQLATPGTVRLTAETARLAEGFIQARPLGPVPVKGLHEPLEVFELLGAEPARKRLQAAAARGLTPFVGRHEELDALAQALEQAGHGHGQLVALVGEAGVGKSRLFWEFTRSPRCRGWLVLESGSVSYGKATAYLPVIDLLTAYFQVQAADEPRTLRERVTGKLLTLDDSLKPTLPVFFDLLGVPFDDPAWRALDPAERRQRTLAGLKRLLVRESRVQPLCLVFEDLHWIDSETQALLDHVVESLATARILLLVNYRPEYQHGWASKSNYAQLRINPLPPESAEDLLRAALGDSPELADLKRLLIARTEGNPFFLEESVRMLVETKVLVGEPAAYRLVRAVPDIEVPASVQAVLAARVDRLPPEEKHLLQCASVIGKDVPFTLLHAIAELPEEAVHRGLSRLQGAEFLYETSLFPELEYTFKHALTYQVAYAGLLRERRRTLHARIAQAMELLYPRRRAELIERLAHHAYLGELWEKAVTYLGEAGVKAIERAANREAASLLEKGLAALEHLPESRQTLEQAVDLRFHLRTALVPLGELERILEHLQSAEGLAARLADRSRLARASSYLTNYFWQMGQHERAVESARQALLIAGEIGDSGLEVATRFYLGQAFFNLGDYRQARDLNRSNVELLTSQAARGVAERPAFLVLSGTWMVWALAELGEFADGIAHAEENLRIARAAGQPFILTHAYIGLGAVHLRRGDLEKAIPALESCLELVRTWEFPVFFPAIAPPLGYAYALSGRLDEALPLLRQAVEQAASMRLMASQSLRSVWLGEAYLLAGQIEEAAAYATSALELSRAHGERGYQGWVLRLLGEIAARLDAREATEPEDSRQAVEAEECYRQALGLAEELGMRPLLGQCHLGLGALYLEVGRGDEARAELRAARDLFAAIGMTSWLARAEVLLAAPSSLSPAP